MLVRLVGLLRLHRLKAIRRLGDRGKTWEPVRRAQVSMTEAMVLTVGRIVARLCSKLLLCRRRNMKGGIHGSEGGSSGAGSIGRISGFGMLSSGSLLQGAEVRGGDAILGSGMGSLDSILDESCSVHI